MILQSDARASKAEISREVGLTPGAVHARIRRLEESGVIRGYLTRIEPRALGYDLSAYVFVEERKPVTGEHVPDRLARLDGVEEVHRIAGEDCYLMKVRARNTADLTELLDQTARISHVASTRTTIVLDTTVEDRPVPIASTEV